jgi:hypothetical protein
MRSSSPTHRPIFSPFPKLPVRNDQKENNAAAILATIRAPPGAQDRPRTSCRHHRVMQAELVECLIPESEWNAELHTILQIRYLHEPRGARFARADFPPLEQAVVITAPFRPSWWSPWSRDSSCRPQRRRRRQRSAPVPPGAQLDRAPPLDKLPPSPSWRSPWSRDSSCRPQRRRRRQRSAPVLPRAQLDRAPPLDKLPPSPSWWSPWSRDSSCRPQRRRRRQRSAPVPPGAQLDRAPPLDKLPPSPSWWSPWSRDSSCRPQRRRRRGHDPRQCRPVRRSTAPPVEYRTILTEI